MITKKTVLVLGAGASAPFGFPSGAELVKRMCADLRSGPTREEIDKILEVNHFGGDLDCFLDTLARSGQLSIDAFLEHNREFLAMGKLAIAGVLLPLEDEDSLFTFDSFNWYKLLFSQLNAEFDEFARNALSVITFNYDRSLEHFLITALKNSHPGKGYDDCIRQVQSMPIVHLHGSLGRLPEHERDVDKGARGYVPRTSNYDLRVAEKQIRIIHEEVEKDPAFATAKELLASAEVVALLGFGYDPLNLKRLDLRGLAIDRGMGAQKCDFYGTTYELGGARTEWVHRYFFGQITLVDCRVEKMLADYPILLQPPDETAMDI